jgi:DegV family protein with EDD domain
LLHVVTDSSCDLPQEMIESNSIRIVPLTVNIDDQSYRERVDITPEEFYDRMAASRRLPKTSQPSPAAFSDVFRELGELGQVLCLTISSKLSGTYQSARLAQEMSGADVTVFDTLAGSLGHGLQVLRACRLAQAGATVREIVGELSEYRRKMKILILLQTLENIVKGGRLSRFQGSLASILNIKLILHNVDGEVQLLEKVRGSKRFLQRVVQVAQEFCTDLGDREVGLTHFRNLEDAERIKQSLSEQLSAQSFLTNSMGPTMATYAGEGGIIVAF